MTLLKVEKACWEDVFKDTVRVTGLHRVDICGQTIPTGTLCRIRCVGSKRSIYAFLRGFEDTEQHAQSIHMGEHLRQKLDVHGGHEYDFRFSLAKDPLSHMLWAWQATDVGYQISLRISITSFIMSALLGTVSILISLRAI